MFRWYVVLGHHQWTKCGVAWHKFHVIHKHVVPWLLDLRFEVKDCHAVCLSFLKGCSAVAQPCRLEFMVTHCCWAKNNIVVVDSTLKLDAQGLEGFDGWGLGLGLEATLLHMKRFWWNTHGGLGIRGCSHFYAILPCIFEHTMVSSFLFPKCFSSFPSIDDITFITKHFMHNKLTLLCHCKRIPTLALVKFPWKI